MATPLSTIAWWAVFGVVLLALTTAIAVGGRLGVLNDVEFHRMTSAVFVGLLVLASNVMGVLLVARDFDTTEAVTLRGFAGPAFKVQDGTLTYMARKLRALFLALAPLFILLLFYLGVFVAAGVLHPVTLGFMALTIPMGLIHGGAQGGLARLLVGSTANGVALMIVGLLAEALLPLVCCLPTFNLPLTAYFLVEPAALPARVWASGQVSYMTAMGLALVFSLGTQVIATGVCVGIGAWRFNSLKGKTREAEGRRGLVPCRHCGERIDPEATTCPMCGEAGPFESSV